LKATILGLGQWIPCAVRGNDAWPREFAAAHAARLDAELTNVPVNADGDRIERLVASYALPEASDPFLGTRLRRVADPSVTACAAETGAAREALADAGVEPRDVDAVLSSSAVPDRLTPPTAASVAHALGARRAWTAGLDAVCASTVVALEVAVALVASKAARFVLLTQSHLMTRAFAPAHPASPNVGDASTAVVIGPAARGGFIGSCIATHGEYTDAVVWRRPKGADTPWWEAGGPMSMGSYDPTRARKLVQDTVRIGAATVGELLEREAVPPGDIDVLAAVQPRRWIPRAIAEAAGIDPARAIDTFGERAHLGACGVVVNLLEARQAGSLRAGAHVVLYGQGAGFTRAAALLEWT
jgi:3-oxoacyl-[acyl-carrier-protein] synthase-3